MKNDMITFEVTTFSLNEREVTRYQPVLDGANNPCFSGRIQFAFWEVWTDEAQHLHDKAKSNAVKSAKQVIRNLLKGV